MITLPPLVIKMKQNTNNVKSLFHCKSEGVKGLFFFFLIHTIFTCHAGLYNLLDSKHTLNHNPNAKPFHPHFPKWTAHKQKKT